MTVIPFAYYIHSPLTVEANYSLGPFAVADPADMTGKKLRVLLYHLPYLMLSLCWANGLTALSPSPLKVQNDADPMSAQIIPPPKPRQLGTLYFPCSP